jgi:hypothetical protein
MHFQRPMTTPRGGLMVGAIYDEPAVMVMADEWAWRELRAADQVRAALERRGLPAEVCSGQGLAWVSIWAGSVMKCEQNPYGVEFRWSSVRVVDGTALQVNCRCVAWPRTQQACVEMVAGELAATAPHVAMRTWELLARERIQEEWGEVTRAWLDQAGAEMGLPAMSDAEWAKIVSCDWVRQAP